MDEQITIQWFPGHMAKTRRLITDNVKLVDAVCEVIDSRIPVSSRNPELDSLTAGKPRIIILNRADQADPEMTKRWAAYLKRGGASVIVVDAKSGKGTDAFIPAVRGLLKERIAKLEAKGQTGNQIRVMVVGIPNVGKSSLINRLAKRKAAEASDRPGVTRGKQWINLEKGTELLDMPGILWPKFEDKTVGEHLAFTGAVKDTILDTESLAARLMECLRDVNPGALAARYKIDVTPESKGFDLLEAAARKRGFLISGGELDLLRMSEILLDEFRGGKLGRITLEAPPEN